MNENAPRLEFVFISGFLHIEIDPEEAILANRLDGDLARHVYIYNANIFIKC